MRHGHVVGDLQVNRDGTVDGWCWAPDRPQARLAFEVLVDDRPAGRGVADLARPDLALPGMDDTQHGFWLRLPPGSIDPEAPCLISARERRTAIVFGRRLEQARTPPPDPATLALAASLGALSERLAGAGPGPSSAAGARLREAAGVLAATLPRAPGVAEGSTAAARAALALGGTPPVLARPAAPRVSMLLRAGATPSETLGRLQAVAPATHALAAETLLLADGDDARIALLPSLVPGLLLLPNATWQAALQFTRGDWLLLLDETTPSPAGLQAALARLQADGVAIAASARLPEAAGLRPLALPVPAGLALAMRRDAALPDEAPGATLRRLRRQGAPCRALASAWRGL